VEEPAAFISPGGKASSAALDGMFIGATLRICYSGVPPMHDRFDGHKRDLRRFPLVDLVTLTLL